MKKIISVIFLISTLSTAVRADSACNIATILLTGPFCLLIPSGPDELEESNNLKLRQSDEVHFWEPEYLQPKRPEPRLFEGRFYALPQILGAQFTHASVSFTSVDLTLINKFTGPSTRAFPFYGAEIGFYLSDQISVNAAMYSGSGTGGNSLENSGAGGIVDRKYSAKAYQGGLTFHFAGILYVAAFAGSRTVDIHSDLAYVVSGVLKTATVSQVNYTKTIYGFGIGLNFEFADHFLFRLGANVMPQFIAEYGFSRSAAEYPISMQMGLGVIF